MRAGSIGLRVTLALIMDLTRNFDWYGKARYLEERSRQEGLLDGQ